MNNGINIIINLLGKVGKRERHTTHQVVSYKYTDDDGKILTKSKNILHTDRKNQGCYKRTSISGEIINQWINGANPSFISSKKWKQLSPKQKVEAYVATYDEGYGVSYEIL